MQYLLKVADSAGQHMVLLTMEESVADNQAIDVVFEVLGSESPDELVSLNVLGAGQIEDLLALQEIIFDKDDQGLFVREGVEFEANHKPLDPEAVIKNFFQPADRDGIKYMHCELTVSSPALKSLSAGKRAP
jgi:hypothetical protein